MPGQEHGEAGLMKYPLVFHRHGEVLIAGCGCRLIIAVFLPNMRPGQIDVVRNAVRQAVGQIILVSVAFNLLAAKTRRPNKYICPPLITGLNTR